MKSHLVKGGNLKKDYNFFSKILALPVLSGLYHSIGVAQGNEPVIVMTITGPLLQAYQLR